MTPAEPRLAAHPAPSSAPLRVVIAEDAAIMRDGLTQTLARRGLDVVAAVADAEALLRAIGEQRPDVAIIDVRMPPTHTDEGLRAARSIHADHPEVGVLVFSQYIEAQAAAELLAGTPAGVGYLLKDRLADDGDFIEAISRVAQAGTVLDPEVVRHLLRASRADSLATLTPREREVLAFLAQGARTPPSRASSRSHLELWRSTSPASSPSSASPRPRATTAG